MFANVKPLEYSRAKGSDDRFGRDSYKNSSVNKALYSVVHMFPVLTPSVKCSHMFPWRVVPASGHIFTDVVMFDSFHEMEHDQQDAPEGVLKKVLYGEAPPLGPIPYPFIYHFFQKRHPFRIPFIGKRNPFHIPSYE